MPEYMEIQLTISQAFWEGIIWGFSIGGVFGLFGFLFFGLKKGWFS